MRRSREAKADTHEAIVAQASRLFRERGVEGTSVGDVMQAAQRTHGGFYRHFDTKDALLVAALKSAFGDMRSTMQSGVSSVAPGQVVEAFLSYYLAPAMVENAGEGCPVVALAGDVARASPTLKAEFGAELRDTIKTLAEALDGPEDDRVGRATRLFALAVGAVVMARASDPETADLIVSSVREGSKA